MWGNKALRHFALAFFDVTKSIVNAFPATKVVGLATAVTCGCNPRHGGTLAVRAARRLKRLQIGSAADVALWARDV